MNTLHSKDGPTNWEYMLEQLTEQLENIQRAHGYHTLTLAKEGLEACKVCLIRMEEFVLQQGFQDQSEEIRFFKYTKPQCLGHLMFYQELYNFEILKPIGGSGQLQAYFQKKLSQLNETFNINIFWYRYYRAGDTSLDEKLFLRNQQPAPLFVETFEVHRNNDFSTHFDYIFSRIVANDLMALYLHQSMPQLNSGSETIHHPTFQHAPKKLDWTDPKVALIEMIYALKAKGAFNAGKATLKEIADYLQYVFHVEIKNPTRDLQDILHRKKTYTNYLDSLRESYLRYIDDIESKNHH